MRRGEVDPFEVAWRIQETWDAHVRQHIGFYEDLEGHAPFGPKPTLTSEIRKEIQRALLEYDAHLLTADQRSAWLEESKVRAAGIGIYADRFLTGRHPDNDVRNGGRRYLEHWRAWKKQRGKGDPVERFAELYWTVKAAQGRKK